MYQITAQNIPNGSQELRIWRAGDDIEKDPICTVMNLKNLADGQAKVSLAKGELNNDMNMQIGLEAMILGYHWLMFSVARGERVTRHATFLYFDGTYDWYGADLVSLKAELGI